MAGNNNRRRFQYDDDLEAGEGQTDKHGNIWISPHGTDLDRMQALYHEQVHSFFTPKGPLSEVRANISMGAYNKSHLLRYTEEALAESVSQLRTRGQTGVGILGNLWEGLLLPLNPSYNLKRSRILLEAALYGGTIVGTSYVTTKLLGK